jgi:tetratricopeptide (TPR) repeat protein
MLCDKCYYQVDLYQMDGSMHRCSLFLAAALVGTTMAVVQPVVAAISASELEVIARAVAVEIKLKSDSTAVGSGVIIDRQRDLYTLVTNAHVVCGGGRCSELLAGETYSLGLSDGQQYQVKGSSVKLLGDDLDLAIIQFRSSRNYTVAKVAAAGSLKVGDEVYASGFPCERNPIPSIPCQPLGYIFRNGKAIAVVNKRLDGDNGGYTIVYDAFTLSGMSGGGVFNSSGQLVAIHGYGDRVTENTVTDNKLIIGSKVGYNRGIPVRWLVQNLADLGISLRTNRSIRPLSDIRDARSQIPATADEYFIAGFNKFIEPGDDIVAGKQQAIQELSRAIRLNPRYQYAYFLRASIHSRAQEFQKSLADYNQAILLNPKYSEAYNSRALLKNEKLNDIQGALSDYNQAILLYPKHYEAYNNRAILKNEKLNDIQGALSDYNQAISFSPKGSVAYNNRANLKKNKLNDIQGALSDYNQAILFSPRDSFAYYNRANLKADQLNDIQGALSDYNQAILLDPKHSEAYNNRALLKRNKLNDIQGALADYNQAILLNPKHSEAYYNRAILKNNELNDIQGALADYNQAILLNPQDSEAYNNRAILKRNKLNDIQGALADYNQAILLNPKHSFAYYNRALLKNDELNDQAGAIQDLRQAARLLREQGNNQNAQLAIEALQRLGAIE